MKNKKLKIDPGRAGSQRLVFDEEGNALPPLAALARGGHEDDDDDVPGKATSLIQYLSPP